MLALVLSSVFCSFCFTTPTYADPLPPELAEYDLNGDGIVSPEEIELIQSTINATPTNPDSTGNGEENDPSSTETETPSIDSDDYLKYDLNGDGIVSPEEIELITNTMNGVDSDGNPLPD